MICVFNTIHYCLRMRFENFRDKYIETYGLDPAHFLSAPGLACKLA